MRACVVEALGRAPVLGEAPEPRPGPGEVRIAVAACGINFADLLLIEGTYQTRLVPPFIPGMEVAGTVRSVSDGTSGVRPGDRVAAYLGAGGLAEVAVCAADRCVVLPPEMPFVEAAGFLVAYGTSHLALARRARLRPGETLLVLGAGGGVGLTAVEIGKAMGARVIAVARGADKGRLAAGAGADHVLDCAPEDLRDRLLALGGVDVVYDPVGGRLAEQAIRGCRPEGRLVVIGFASGTVPTLRANHLMVKNLDVIGMHWSAYFAHAPQVVTESLATLLGWYAEGRLRPRVEETRPLERAAEALDLLRQRRARGKVVVTI